MTSRQHNENHAAKRTADKAWVCTCMLLAEHATPGRSAHSFVRFSKRKQSCCPQPVPLGNLVGLKTTKESFHNWFHKHFFVKMEVEILWFYCKNENRFLCKNIHSTRHTLPVSNTCLRVDLVWTGITQTCASFTPQTGKHIHGVHPSRKRCNFVIRATPPPSGGGCQGGQRGLEQQTAGTLQRCIWAEIQFFTGMGAYLLRSVWRCPDVFHTLLFMTYQYFHYLKII